MLKVLNDINRIISYPQSFQPLLFSRPRLNPWTSWTDRFFWASRFLWPPYVIGQAIYIFVLLFVLVSFFLLFLSSPNFSRRNWMSTILHTWCGLSANLRCRSETCCAGLAASTGRKKSSKNRNQGAIAQLCRAISSQLRHISTIGKTLRRWTEGATYIQQGGHHVGHWPTF